MAKKFSKKASAKVARAMKKRKSGTLKSGSTGKAVKSRKQAIAIGLSEARAEGNKVPSKKTAKTSGKKATKKTSAKKTSAKKAAAKKSMKKSSPKRTTKSSSPKKSAGRKSAKRKTSKKSSKKS